MTPERIEQLKVLAASDGAMVGLASQCALSELIAEIERLRGLIKNAEYTDTGYSAGVYTCNWCFEEHPKHAENCPAFTPDGEVK